MPFLVRKEAFARLGLGKIGGRDDLKLLEKVAQRDPLLTMLPDGKGGKTGRYFVREAAQHAIDSIESRLRPR